SGVIQRLENVPQRSLVALVEGEPGWKAEPFKERHAAAAKQQPSPPPEVLPDGFESWLIEPFPAFDFSLPGLDGQTRTLKSFEAKPLLLVLVRGACEPSRRQLLNLAGASTAFDRQSVRIAAMHLDADAQAIREFAGRNPVPFPVLLADQ